MGLAVDQLVAPWRRSLRQRSLAARTIETYVESATQLSGWLADRGITDVDAVTRDHVADFITHLIETLSPSTASVRFRSLQQFFGWLAEEGELPGPNSMERMRSPMSRSPPDRCGRRSRRAGGGGAGQGSPSPGRALRRQDDRGARPYLRVHSSRLPRLDGRRDCLDGNPASCDQRTVDSIPSG